MAYAQHFGEVREAVPPAELPTEAKGLKLHMSDRSSTGYRGVYQDGGRFAAQMCVEGKNVRLGTFDTAVEAAVAVARFVAANEEAVAEEGEEEEEEEEDEEAAASAGGDAEEEEAAAAAPAARGRRGAGGRTAAHRSWRCRCRRR